MPQKTISLKLTQEQSNQLRAAWQEDASVPAVLPPYASWQLKLEGCVITCYSSGKVVFQGADAEVYASPYQASAQMPAQAETAVPSEVRLPQAGSDEVGTGDYFGPVCVCATIVLPEQLPLLQKLGVRDSKALTDADIRRIAPELMKALTYSLLIVDNRKYNEVHAVSNMNAVKAKLHNQAYVNLSRKTALPSFKIIDQFAEEPIYYHYLKKEPTVVRGIHFETKAENKYPAVGAASIIARYAFLISMDEMEKKYDMHFQKGAGTAVDHDAREFAKRYGFDRLGEVAKLHFKNTERIK